MENVRDEAVKAYNEGRKETAKKAFQSKVNSILLDISSYTEKLAGAKQRFAELNYEDPPDIEV